MCDIGASILRVRVPLSALHVHALWKPTHAKVTSYMSRSLQSTIEYMTGDEAFQMGLP